MSLFKIFLGINIIPGPEIRSSSIEQKVQLIVGSLEIHHDLNDLRVELLRVTLRNGLNQVEHVHSHCVLDR
jgi:hypothetical protein